MSTKIGRQAEADAADYLRSCGYDILQQNWKTRYCEIDIVAQKASTIYLVEVKYRRGAKHGMGAEYVTSTKLKRMHFAAEMWVQQHNWNGDYQLAVVSIDNQVITLIDDL